jgi:hypothetical protein
MYINFVYLVSKFNSVLTVSLELFLSSLLLILTGNITLNTLKAHCCKQYMPFSI